MNVVRIRYEGHSLVLISKIITDPFNKSCKGCLFSDEFDEPGCSRDVEYSKFYNIALKMNRYDLLPCSTANVVDASQSNIVIGRYNTDISIYLSRYIFKKYGHKDSRVNS